MKTTVKHLKLLCELLPDDAEVWVEYPQQLAEPIVTEKFFEGCYTATLIESLSAGVDKKNNRLIIFHHS
ncbi:MAG: hypothetical protein ABL911_04625 [Gallionella sp.]|nr:hypothetical protein [Gallionella sp.]